MPGHSGYCFSTQRVEVPSLAHFRIITEEKANHISLIDSDVARADEIILKTLNRRAALHRARNAFLPAVNLPQETLETIFHFACHRPKDDKGLIVTEIEEDSSIHAIPIKRNDLLPVTPLFIGSVCSSWRSVALEASQLWNDVRLRVSEDRARMQAESLHYWLARSGQRPLTVKFIDDSPIDSAIESTTVIDVLASHAHRLHAVDVPTPDTWTNALIVIVNSAHALTHLTLRRTNQPPFERFDYFAHLCDATLIGHSPMRVPLPWAQIERLAIICKSTPITSCFKILQYCPLLRGLSVQLLDDRGSEIAAPGPLTHTSLETLEIISYDGVDLETFLQPLTLPNLSSFSSLNKTDDSIISVLLPLIERSGCTLETLWLVGLLPTDDLAECLNAVPGLRNLVVYDLDEFEPNFLTRRLLDMMNPKRYGNARRETKDYYLRENEDRWTQLYRKGSETCLCPKLESFFYYGDTNFRGHDLVEFLADRWDNVPNTCQDFHSGQYATEPGRLTSNQVLVSRLYSATFHLQIGFDLGAADEAILEKLQAEGMHIEIVGLNTHESSDASY